MKGEGGTTGRMRNSPKVLLEHSVLYKRGRPANNQRQCMFQP